ncbi:MAG: hypothetical protein GY790_08260, partial [Bacteroidetes bacterium]|nr:hypothetical protein [Bacteroidota bacterium]
RGHVGIINLVRRFSVESEISPEDFTEQPEINPGGITVNTYFNKLHEELEKADC